MYSNKLVCALKVDGKILREFDDTVYIPFGSEYSILLKNLSTTKCVVSLELDGRNIGGGNKFIIAPNDSLEIERFITEGNLSTGNKLKFIERTGAIEEHRGIKVDDGLLRISFKHERVGVNQIQINNPHMFDYYPPGCRNFSSESYPKGMRSRDSLIGSQATLDANFTSVKSQVTSSVCYDTHNTSAHVNDVGITVEGSISTQQFSQGHVGQLESTEHVMVLKLLGEVGGGKIAAPIDVKHSPICKTCGTKNSAVKTKFCKECGTALTII